MLTNYVSAIGPMTQERRGVQRGGRRAADHVVPGDAEPVQGQPGHGLHDADHDRRPGGDGACSGCWAAPRRRARRDDSAPPASGDGEGPDVVHQPRRGGGVEQFAGPSAASVTAEQQNLDQMRTGDDPRRDRARAGAPGLAGFQLQQILPHGEAVPGRAGDADAAGRADGHRRVLRPVQVAGAELRRRRGSASSRSPTTPSRRTRP